MEEKQERKINVIISKTNTKMGVVIRRATRYDFNHVSIAIDDELKDMYSFARYRHNTTLVGGFIKESWLRYLSGTKPAEIKIYTVPVTEEGYQKVREIIDDFSQNREEHIYDTLAAIGIQRDRSKTKFDMYTCLTFAVMLLKAAGVLCEGDEIQTIRALDGRLSRYSMVARRLSPMDAEGHQWGADDYSQSDSIRESITKTLRHLRNVTK